MYIIRVRGYHNLVTSTKTRASRLPVTGGNSIYIHILLIFIYMHLCIQYNTRKRNIQAAKLWAKILRGEDEKNKM